MKSETTKYLNYTLICMISGLSLCVIIKPHGLAANEGISYYGTFRSTIAPYALSLLGSAWFISRLHSSLDGELKWLQTAFLIFPLLIIGTFLTPYTFGRLFSTTHVIFGSILFASQLLLSLYLSFKLRHKLLAACLWLAELTSGIMCAIYLNPKKGYLIEFQVLFQLCFMAILSLYSQLNALPHRQTSQTP